MNWRLFVSIRYLVAQRKERFISIISLISILGVAVGVAALIIVISVMTGFEEDLKTKIVGTYSHIEVISDHGMKPSSGLTARILGTPHVKAMSYFLTGQGLVRAGDNIVGVIVKGVVSHNEARVNRLEDYLKKGSLSLEGGGILIGSELAGKLGVRVGDTVSLFSPAAISAAKYKFPNTISIESSDFRVAGIFTSGMYEYDISLTYIDIADAQKFLGVGDIASGVAIKVDNAISVDDTKRELRARLGPEHAVRTWMELNKNLMAAIKLEKTVMFIILTLIVIVACFNIASTLIMTVLEKTRDIGILKAVGATNLDIMVIFGLQGGLVGIIGTVLGTSAGIGICWCLKTYRFISLPKEIYYIDKLPVKMDLYDIMLIVIVALLQSLLLSIYPAYKASRLDPVESLRYE